MDITPVAATILAVFTGLLVVYFSLPVIIRIARAKNLYDNPDNERKLHRNSTPSLGGVAILASLLVSYSIWGAGWLPEYFPFLVASLVMLFAVGIKDDIMTISPRKKTLMQVAASATMVIGGNIRLLNFDGFLGVHDGTPEFLAVIVTIFAFVIIINAFNLLDGVDGLAGSVSGISALFFGIWFYVNGFYGDAILAVTLFGSLAGFLFYNRHPAKIFMGDTGSMIIGLIMATLSFRLIGMNPDAVVMQLDTPTVFAFSLMIVPMFDTFRIIIVRLLSNKSPLAADKRHLHHCLLRLGYSQRQTCRVLLASSILIVVVSYFINHLEIHLYGLLLLVLGALICPVAWLGIRLAHKFRREKTYKPIDACSLSDLLHCFVHGLENGSEHVVTKHTKLKTLVKETRKD